VQTTGSSKKIERGLLLPSCGGAKETGGEKENFKLHEKQPMEFLGQRGHTEEKP